MKYFWILKYTDIDGKEVSNRYFTSKKKALEFLKNLSYIYDMEIYAENMASDKFRFCILSEDSFLSWTDNAYSQKNDYFPMFLYRQEFDQLKKNY